MMRDRLRANLLRFTDRALSAIPVIPRPLVLDIGCGSGVPTVRPGGHVVGIDPDASTLDGLRHRAAAGYADRIHPCVASATALPFRDAAFDIVWCEGAVYVLGFEASLVAWRRLLKPRGALVVHDEAGDPDAKRGTALRLGYTVLDTFTLSESDWWDAYYQHAAIAPPESLEPELRSELAAFERDPARFRSAFFVLRAPDADRAGGPWAPG